MELGIEGRVAIVSGSSKGMGRATAYALAQEGAYVVVCARGRDELERTASDIAEATSPRQVLPVVADLCRPEDVEHLVRETARQWGHVDIVVNNVGGPPPGQAWELSEQQWQAGLEVSFYSVVRLCRLTLPMMRERKWGRIVNVLSAAVKEPEDNLALSTVGRAAVAAYAKLLSQELAPSNITVNNALPGSIETDRLRLVAEMQARFHGRDPRAGLDHRRAQIPMGRFGRPEEMAALICFLVSERAAFITGTSVLVDGGQVKALV